MDLNSRSLSGVACVVTFVVLAGMREVYFADILRQIDIFVLISGVFTITAVVFFVLRLGSLSELISMVRLNLREVILINLSTAIGWFTLILALRSVEPAIVSSIANSLVPVATLAIGPVMLAEFRSTRGDLLCALGVVLCVFWLMYISLSGQSFVANDNRLAVTYGLVSVFVSGLTASVNTIAAKRLALRGFAAGDTMAVRFYILILFSLGWLFVRQIPLQLRLDQIVVVVVIALIGISFPIYVLQLGIARLDVKSVALIMGATPVATYVVQVAKGGFGFSFYSLIGVIMTFVFVSLGIALKNRVFSKL